MKLRIKDYATKVGSGVTPRGGSETYLNEGIPLFRSQNIHNEALLMDDVAYISEEVDESMKGTRVKPGDVLLNITGASIGRCYYTPQDFKRGNVNQHVCIIRPNKKTVIAPYLHYLIISDIGQSQIDLVQTGANREGLTISDIRNFSFDIPSLETQHKVVAYLDNKIKSVDFRISILDKQLKLYERLKKSFIQNAVTRGLNPSVDLRGSGVDWIGHIPAHWEIKRFKDIFKKYTTGFTPPSKDERNFSNDSTKTWITIADLTNKFVSDSSLYLSQKAIEDNEAVLVKKGALLFSFKLSIGKVAFAGKDLYTNEAIVSIPPRERYSLSFFYYLIPLICLNNATENIYGAKMLNQKIIANMLIPVPPLSEQNAIAQYLDEKCAKIDAALENITKQIDLSKRLKRAIINEALNGDFN